MTSKDQPLKFPYRSLSNDEIRLIKLKPATGTAPLACEIIHEPLSSSRTYEAISYTWADHCGDVSPCRQLRVYPGYVLNITRNCEAALQEFRSPVAVRFLWVDSICINQKDTEERSKQVAKMTDIYRTAVRVLVYLGDRYGMSPEELQSLLDYIHEVNCNNQGLECTRPHEHCTFQDWFEGRKLNLIKSDYSKQQANRPKREYMALLQKFFMLPWFSRIWVLQETVMAKDVIVSCAKRQIQWGCLILYPYMAFHPFQFITSNIKTEIPAVLRMGSELKPGEGNFINLLLETSTCRSSDPRDRIFALLPFCKAAQSVVSPDYSKEAKDVFWEATKFCVVHYQSLKILTLFDHPQEGVPSWVPDLSHYPSSDKNRRVPIGLCGFAPWAAAAGSPMTIQDTSKPSNSNNPWLSSISDIEGTENRVLRVPGRQIGRVLMAFRPSPDTISGCESWVSNNANRQTFQRDLGHAPILVLKELLYLLEKNSVANPWVLSHCQELVQKTKPRTLHRHSKTVAVNPLAPPEGIPGPPENIDLEVVDLLAPKLEHIRPLYMMKGLREQEPQRDWLWSKFADKRRDSRRVKGPSYLNRENLYYLVEMIGDLGAERQIIVTEHSIGVGPGLARVGDLIYLLPGLNVPFMLQPTDWTHKIVGETLLVPPSGDCYVPGCRCKACDPYHDWEKVWKEEQIEMLALS